MQTDILYFQQPDGTLRGFRLVPIDGAAPLAAMTAGLAATTAGPLRFGTPTEAAVEAELSRIYGSGHDLLPGLRSTDPRIFAVGFSRHDGGPHGKGWTQAQASAAAAKLLNTDRTGRTVRRGLETRRLGVAQYGFSDADLAAQWLYRIVTERTPASFDLATLVGLPAANGVIVYVADRIRPRALRSLPSVTELAGGGA